jgi:hypothetical protein
VIASAIVIAGAIPGSIHVEAVAAAVTNEFRPTDAAVTSTGVVAVNFVSPVGTPGFRIAVTV